MNFMGKEGMESGRSSTENRNGKGKIMKKRRVRGVSEWNRERGGRSNKKTEWGKENQQGVQRRRRGKVK